MSERTKELAQRTIKDIAKMRETRQSEIFAYLKEQSVKKKRNWNVRHGGFKW